ncbi:hypothetical protein L3073_03920 [Ancylomarina sp. DW003]|nr:hypothetical protein [Ancylomarina sp. DW003]MDE5421345.1 hypothetical protein [Ancylomarina sp. DW003]
MKIKEWCRNYPWLGIIGSILIFLSWVYQNQLLSTATEERIKLENTQISIDLQEIRMEMWHKAYVEEKTKQNPDTQILLNTSFKTLQSYLNIIAWSSIRTRNDELDKQKDIKGKYLTLDTLTKWYQSKNLKALETDLGTVIKRENELRFEDQFANKYGKKLVEIDLTVKLYTRLFIILFAIGSILIGLDFMLKLNKDRR